MTKAEAIEQARQLTARERRQYVVRNSGFTTAPKYFVCQQYEPGREGYQHDAGYTGLGSLVWPVTS